MPGYQAVATSAVALRGSSERVPAAQAVRQTPRPQHLVRSTMMPARRDAAHGQTVGPQRGEGVA